ncbi:hypothetical protein JOB18_025390 [Solea senegalensis]|uniref:Uncharacterized protein n=1 Tax=Solea senegalensis TaxID=28829 RepID=A0AAV6PDR8_SOLSE|nr:hypothetical protein JOB18_025390 [Solea senegalensis]
MKTEDDPESPHIKEEQEEPLLKEVDCNTFSLTIVLVKTEDDEEKPQSSPHHSQTDENRETEPPATVSARPVKTEAGGDDHVHSDKDDNETPDSSQTEDSPRWFISATRDLPPADLLTDVDFAWLNALHMGGREQDNRRIVLIFTPDLNVQRHLLVIPELRVQWL